jgi:hypothetical protein
MAFPKKIPEVLLQGHWYMPTLYVPEAPAFCTIMMIIVIAERTR